MPAGPIEHHDDVLVLGNGRGETVEELLHRLGVRIRQDQSETVGILPSIESMTTGNHDLPAQGIALRPHESSPSIDGISPSVRSPWKRVAQTP